MHVHKQYIYLGRRRNPLQMDACLGIQQKLKSGTGISNDDTDEDYRFLCNDNEVDLALENSKCTTEKGNSVRELL